HPSWIGPVTDWLLTALTWPELAVVIYATLWLHHAHWAGALSWWLLSAALLCYAVARTVWTVDEQLILHYDLPFPSVPDLVFALQYPFFFAALVFVPRTRLAGPRLIPLLDSLLWIGTAAALSWYFILAPIFIQSWLSPLARAVSLAYPLGDLLVLFSLTVILLFPNRFQAPRPVFGLMMAAFVCLILGDSVAVGLVLHPHLVFRRGDLPDLFWMACYLLIPVAALVLVRLAAGTPLPSTVPLVRLGYLWDDVVASLHILVPLLAALLGSAAILVRAIRAPAQVGWTGMVSSIVVSVSLLLLAVARLELTLVENRRLQRGGGGGRADQRGEGGAHPATRSGFGYAHH